MKKQEEDIQQNQNEKMNKLEIFLHKWHTVPKACELWYGVEVTSSIFD